MVPGQLNDEQGQYSTEEPSNILLPGARRNDIPPPGLQRMVPGESSRPETQNVLQMPEQRVVTGVAKEEININPLPTTITSQSPTSGNNINTLFTYNNKSAKVHHILSFLQILEILSFKLTQ